MRALTSALFALSLLTLSGVIPASAADPPRGDSTGPARAPSAPLIYAPIGRVLGAPITRFAFADTIEIVGWRIGTASVGSGSSSGPSGALRPAPDPKYQGSLLLTTMLRPHTYERSRTARVIYGADRMAGTAAALGGLGLVGGVWGEKTAGYLMGAGAVLGALWGGTVGANDPAIRIGIDTEPRMLDPGRRTHEIPGERR